MFQGAEVFQEAAEAPRGYYGQPGGPSGQHRDAFDGFQQQPGLEPRYGPAGGVGAFAAPTTAVGVPAERKGSSKRKRALVVGGGALVVVIAAAGVLFVTKAFGYFGTSDPGCKAYANTALGAYNVAINDLNAQSSQTTLNADMAAAISDLADASAQAQSASAKSALGALLTEVKVVRADVAAGSVPTSTVKALNADSAAADSAC